MFTGIVQGIAKVSNLEKPSEVLRLTLSFPQDSTLGLTLGASVSIDGCCLSVVSIADPQVTFELVPETLSRTTLKNLAGGSLCNFERSLKFGDEVGGHLVSGHVDTVAKVEQVVSYQDSKEIVFSIESSWMKFIFEKGYIAINGASLTIARVDRQENRFAIALIPETLARTTFGSIAAGDKVNLEIERSTQAVVNTVERVLTESWGVSQKELKLMTSKITSLA